MQQLRKSQEGDMTAQKQTRCLGRVDKEKEATFLQKWKGLKKEVEKAEAAQNRQEEEF